MPRFQVEVTGSAIVEAESEEEALAAHPHEMEDVDIHAERVLGEESS